MNELRNQGQQPNTMVATQGVQTPVGIQQENMSERFTRKVLMEFGSTVSGAMEVTAFQKRLIQGYFIMIDRALKVTEEERIRRNNNNTDPKFNNDLPATWSNVNMTDLALDLVRFARMGLDMQQENMLFPIPYKNNKRGCYDITLMKGYNGIRYEALRYAVEQPIGETIELVYSTDTFVPHIRDSAHPFATYEITINNPFDRGEVIGGFGYLEFADSAKNELIMMSVKDILKRKPEYASANFWGGKSTEWQTVNGKRQKVEVEKPGWFEEMCRKTLIREVYSAKHLPRDPQKIDDAYQYLKAREARFAEIQAQAEIDANANTIPIDTTPTPAKLPVPAPTADAVEEVLQKPQKEPMTVWLQESPNTAEAVNEKQSGQNAAQATLYDTPDF